MITFTLNATTKASPEAVFDTLTDHAAYSEFTPIRVSKLEREGTPDPNGVGCIRSLAIVGPPIREEVTEFERPSRFAYTALSGLPVREHGGTVDLRPSGTGTEITWVIRTVPSFPGGDLVLKPVLKKAIGDLLRGVVKAAERRT